jgi:EpsD family peptidyl-prolyl cis-trans isomerase
MITSTFRFALAPVCAAVVVALTACGKAEQKTSTQVAAKVGSEEVSVHQVNQVLQRLNPGEASPEALLTIKQGILEKLIDQELAIEQATANKLHRLPEVVAQIDAARREVLVRAYMQKIGASQAKPSPDEIKKYYAEHPQLFSQRRIFTVQEIVVPVAQGVEEQMRRFAASGRSIEEASTWLNDQNIKFNAGGATRAAEQIPLDLLGQMHALKDGQSIVVMNAQAVTLLRVSSSEQVPLNQAEANTRIEQFLMNQRMTEAVAADLKQLRSSTKIAYVGDFSKVAQRSASPSSPSTPNTPNTQTVIEKGVAGMR